MGNAKLSRNISFLDLGVRQKIAVFMREIPTYVEFKVKAPKTYCASLCLWALFSGISHASVNVSFSNTAPASLQADFLTATTNQYLGTVTKSPFFANTYSLVISSKNPAYQQSFTPIDPNKIVADFIALSTSTYIYGWVDGQHYERFHTLSTLGYYDINCSTPTIFQRIQFPNYAWDASTCVDALGTLNSVIYNQEFSTPTVINGY